MPNYYYILGVKHTATTQEIKVAYRNLTKKYHPDANQDDAFASEKFKAIHEAYETLINADKRAAYDAKFQANETNTKQNNSGNNQKTYNSNQNAKQQSTSYSSQSTNRNSSHGYEQSKAENKTNSQHEKSSSAQKNSYEQTKKSNNESTNYNKPNENKGSLLWIIIIGIGLAILYFTFLNSLSSGNNYTYENTQNTEPIQVSSEAPYEVPLKKSEGYYNTTLTEGEIRWMVRRSLFLDILRPLCKTRRANIEFNKLVDDYNDRVTERDYDQATYDRIKQEIYPETHKLYEEAMKIVQAWN